jgi:hypothetical protein
MTCTKILTEVSNCRSGWTKKYATCRMDYRPTSRLCVIRHVIYSSEQSCPPSFQNNPTKKAEQCYSGMCLLPSIWRKLLWGDQESLDLYPRFSTSSCEEMIPQSILKKSTTMWRKSYALLGMEFPTPLLMSRASVLTQNTREHIKMSWSTSAQDYCEQMRTACHLDKP